MKSRYVKPSKVSPMTVGEYFDLMGNPMEPDSLGANLIYQPAPIVPVEPRAACVDAAMERLADDCGEPHEWKPDAYYDGYADALGDCVARMKREDDGLFWFGVFTGGVCGCLLGFCLSLVGR